MTQTLPTQTLAHPMLLRQHTELAQLQQHAYFLRAALSHLKYVRAARHTPVTSLIALPVPRRNNRGPTSSTTGNTGSPVRTGRSHGPVNVTLSRDMVAVIRSEADALLTPLELGLTGLSAQQAWDSAAYTLLRSQLDSTRSEFLVRDASVALGGRVPRGVEVSGNGFPAAAWIAHPKTFHVLHTHFSTVLGPKHGLVYLSRDSKELFVFDSTPAAAQDVFPQAAVMSYSLGFPLLYDAAARHGTVRTSTAQ